MENFIPPLFVSLLFGCGVVCAQNLPSDLALITDPITLYLTSPAVSTCKQYVGSDENSLVSAESLVTALKMDNFGKKKFSFQSSEGNELIFEVASSGKELLPNLAIKSGDSYQQISPNDLNSVKPEVKAMFDTIRKFFNSRLGVPIRQGDKLQIPNLCDAIGGKDSSSYTRPSFFTWTGLASSMGREVLVASGDVPISCSIAGVTFEGRFAGWYSYDTASALDAGSFEHGVFQGNNIGKVQYVKRMDCTLQNISNSGQSKLQNPSSKNLQDRLSQLKGLLENRLITQDEYDRKRTEILNSL